jgi:hypothetical protein
MEKTLTSLKQFANSPYVELGLIKYLVLKIEGNCELPEIIVNPTQNIKQKVEYIEKAYNEDLTLKANTNIKITDFDFVITLSEVDFL